MGGIFGDNPSPRPKPPAPMPDEESPAVLEARRNEADRIGRRQGRASTVLTNPDNRGGDSYSGRTLGSGAI